MAEIPGTTSRVCRLQLNETEHATAKSSCKAPLRSKQFPST